MFNLFSFLILFALVPLSSPVEDVDFNNDVLPIFREHCFACHGEGKTEGELSLDSLTGILQGGHTSSPLLTPNLSDSELFLRITSLSDGYKMPKDGDPLSQKEISTIGKWIQRVAIPNADARKKSGRVGDPFATSPSSVEPAAYPDTPSKPLVPTPSSDGSSSPRRVAPGKGVGERFLAALGNMQPDQVATFLIGSAFLVVLLGWIFYKAALGRTSRRMTRDGDRIMAFLSMMLGALSTLLLLGMVYLQWRNVKLYNENESLRTQLQSNNAYQPAPLIKIDESNLPLPPHPMHPPRLGGQYYRGNDERNDSLFNRGFYRTATFDLHLVGSSGQQLQWTDEAGDDLEIEIQIQRAPKATRELFTERVRSRATIEHYSETEKGFNQKFKFVSVEEEQLWKARIPLPPVDRWPDARASGMIYLMFGTQPGEGQMPRPHFAVRYDVKLQEGKISKDSVLWMGSMYTLGNRVLVPDDKKILLDRWFDWRPIPVIEGKASMNTELLGVDEHQDK